MRTQNLKQGYLYTVMTECREITIEMYKDITNSLLSDIWNNRATVTFWVDRWEKYANMVSHNNNLSHRDFLEVMLYMNKRVDELAKSLQCEDVIDHIITNS